MAYKSVLKRLNLESYSDYPNAVKNNAKRGIELNEKVNNKCATQVGKVRARQLAKGEAITVDTIKRMYSYLSSTDAFLFLAYLNSTFLLALASGLCVNGFTAGCDSSSLTCSTTSSTTSSATTSTCSTSLDSFSSSLGSNIALISSIISLTSASSSLVAYPISCFSSSFSSSLASTSSSSLAPISAISPPSFTTKILPSSNWYSPAGTATFSSSVMMNTSCPTSKISASIIVPFSKVCCSSLTSIPRTCFIEFNIVFASILIYQLLKIICIFIFYLFLEPINYHRNIYESMCFYPCINNLSYLI